MALALMGQGLIVVKLEDFLCSSNIGNNPLQPQSMDHDGNGELGMMLTRCFPIPVSPKLTFQQEEAVERRNMQIAHSNV
jgi:hypothetical protein